MTVRTMNLTMIDGYPGPKYQEVSGYTDFRFEGPFLVFEIEGDNREILYFRQEYVFEMVSMKGKM